MYLYIYHDGAKREWISPDKEKIEIHFKYLSLSREFVSYKSPQRHGFWKNNVVFECETDNIEEADKRFKKALGKDVRKMPNIGCQVFELLPDYYDVNCEYNIVWDDLSIPV